MTPEQCATVLAVIAQDLEMGDYVKDVLHQSAAYLTEIPMMVNAMEKATAELERSALIADNAAAEIQRLNLALTYARSKS